MHAMCLGVCIKHDMQVYSFKMNAYMCKVTPLYVMHTYACLLNDGSHICCVNMQVV